MTLTTLSPEVSRLAQILKILTKVTFVLCVTLAAMGCPGPNGGEGEGEGEGGLSGDPLSLSQVEFWAYQIQGIDVDGAVDALARSSYDMLVIEPTRTDFSREEGEDSRTRDFDTAAMVARLKNEVASDGVHRKLVIAYIDIGEAEDWRWYFDWTLEDPDTVSGPDDPLPADYPSWIVSRDPDGWTGNYPVAFWDETWKDIVIYGENTGSDPDRNYSSMLDEVIKDGFDGIYLDWVEAFENEDVKVAARLQGITDVAEEMIVFIDEMRQYAQERNPDFLIIQQNAASLIRGGESHPHDHFELLDVIDGIAQEGIWYEGLATDDWDDPDGHDIVVDSDVTSDYIADLDLYLDDGVPVFACEYASANASDAYARGSSRGYVTYATRRTLGQLTDTPPPGLPGRR